MNATQSQAPEVFEVRDCALITRMGGVDSAFSLRELRDRIGKCPTDTIFHHFCEGSIRPSFDDPEFRNDFAVWSSRSLRDRVLAERLGIIDPYKLPDLERLRRLTLDVIEERLSELTTFTLVPAGEEFFFMRAVTVVYDTSVELASLEDFFRRLPEMTNSTIYYHFIEARRRTADRADDFTTWMRKFDQPPQELISQFNRIDFYYMTLHELKARLLEICGEMISHGKVA
jgi:hypothetical protein